MGSDNPKALSPLIYGHIGPYGKFRPGMEKRSRSIWIGGPMAARDSYPSVGPIGHYCQRSVIFGKLGILQLFPQPGKPVDDSLPLGPSRLF